MAQSPTEAIGAALGVAPNSGSTPPPGSTPLPGTALSAADLQHFIFWGVGAVALVVLADFWPKQTILFTGVLGLSVVFRFSDRLSAVIASTQGQAIGGTPPEQDPTRAGSTTASGSEPGGVNRSGVGPAAPAVRRSNVVRYPQSPFMRDLITSHRRDWTKAG